MALASGLIIRLRHCGHMVVHHLPPDIPAFPCLFIHSCHLQSPEEIQRHRHSALGILLSVLQGFQKIPSSRLPVKNTGKHSEHLAVLAVLCISRSIHDPAVIVYAELSHTLPKSLCKLPVFPGLFLSPKERSKFGPLLKPYEIQKAFHGNGSFSCGIGNSHLPLRRPVNKGPELSLAVEPSSSPHISLLCAAPLKEGQDLFYSGHMEPNQLLIPKIHHMVINHPHIENGKTRDHVGPCVGISAAQKTVVPLGPFKIIHTLPCQTIIHRSPVCIKNLGPGIHDILQLFIKRTVHIGLMHTPS